MSIQLSEITKKLPAKDRFNYRSLNATLFEDANKSCIIVDDDPTGNQTVYDIPLLMEWNLEVLTAEFEQKTPVFFLLTNSRSLSKERSTEIYNEIARNIVKASEATGRAFTIISRSDSTLRGHFSEIDVLKKETNFNSAITVFAPVMFEGNRVTVNDEHYLLEDKQLIPVNETPFSQDHTFAYSHANLKKWIQEKTKNTVKSSDVSSLSIDLIRSNSADTLCHEIMDVPNGSFCILNALNYEDLDKVTHALLLAEKLGKKIVYRTSSSFVSSYIGIKPKSLLTNKAMIHANGRKGGLIMVGSYVSKTSEQLNYALKYFSQKNTIEIDVDTVLSENSSQYLQSIITKIDRTLSIGNDILVYTSRKLIIGKNAKSTINIAKKVSDALVHIVREICTPPKYILAKGGITSHDLAVKGLKMKRSIVLGQIQPGVPVWEMNSQTKFPKLPYIVFPGNVGDKKTLLTIIQKLS